MGRVIKFRAQQFNHGSYGFQYGSYVTDNKDYHAIIKESKSSPDEMYNISINPKTLGQFTGLTDKNGVDIYEGDIVFADGNNSNYTVCYGEYEIPSHYDSSPHECTGLYLNRHDVGVCEQHESIGGDCTMLKVIGNIYENKDLI